MAAAFDRGIFRRLQDRGTCSEAAKVLVKPQHVDGESAEGELADEAANKLARGVADKNVQRAEGVVRTSSIMHSSPLWILSAVWIDRRLAPDRIALDTMEAREWQLSRFSISLRQQNP